MAVITDPDQMIQGTEIVLDVTDPVNPTIQLLIAGNLSEDGVEMQAKYSFLKEEWLNMVNNMHLYPFPMLAITDEQYEVGANGSEFSNWTYADDASRKLIRRGGWREYDDTGSVLREYVGVVTQGNIDATDKNTGDRAYFAFDTDAAGTVFTYAGPVDEAVQTFGDAANGNFDKRSNTLGVYIRIEAKTYDQSFSTRALTYNVLRFPLAESTDTDIVATDAEVDTQAPFTNMSFTYLQTSTSRIVGATSNDFGIVVDGSSATLQQIYTFHQRQLRLLADIDSESDAPVQVGNLQDPLMAFVGTTLNTLNARNDDGGGTGVFVDNFDTNFTNNITFADNLEARVAFPFLAAGTIEFNTNAVNDTDAVYWLFFTDAGGNLVNTANAIIINDADGNPITGTVSGQASIAWTMDYDGNVQGGRTPATPAGYLLRAIGLNTMQYVIATGTINRATGQVIAVSPVLERNYVNAA